MKHLFALALSASLLAAPAHAQGDMEEGLKRLEEGARQFFEGLADEMEPAMRGLAARLEPTMRALLRLIDDFDAYEMPERLPNGDIIIRRKPPAPALPDPEYGIEI